jgi:DNA-binding transcriptional ArsR family regulator
LFHPSIKDVRLQAVLHALSDPERVEIFRAIVGAQHAQTCQAFSCVAERNIPKSSLSQHFKLLREAGLIRSERHGVELRNTSRCEEIEGRFPGLILAILNAHAVEVASSVQPLPAPDTVA